MAFMTARITKKPETWLFNDIGDGEYSGILPDGEYDADSVEDEELLTELADKTGLSKEDVKEEMIRLLKDVSLSGVLITTGYVGYLAAAGYMDRSYAVVGDTPAEVAKELLSMFYDGDPEYMDDGEKEDIEWLKSIAAGGVIDE